MATNVPFGPETPISVKVIVEKNTRKFKIPFSELGPDVLPAKLRSLLDIPDGIPIKFQRWSDSGSSYEELDPSDTGVFKKLARAARAKLKLRIKAVVPPLPTLTPYSLPTQYPALASEITLTNTNGALNGIPSPDIVSSLRNSLTSDIATNNSSRLSLASTSSQLTANAPAAALLRATIHNSLNPQSPPQIRELAVRPKSETMASTTSTVVPARPSCAWSVYCNVCDKPAANEHYHCTICDSGDYDLCQACVEAGHHCPGEGHWLVKRTVKDGRVVNSTTETISPKPKPTVIDLPTEMPGAFTDDKKVEAEEERQEDRPSRTCNSCVHVFPEDHFVTCRDCEDYDLCLPCHQGNSHGHHPGHTFKPAVAGTALSPATEALCAAGRNVRHAAICDGCDKNIFGVRHKCLICPDWDFCSECVKTARYKHPNHRFAALYDPIPEPHLPNPRHVGIYCDGPLCENKHDYISGVRFKCAICHDTDFCGNCEANPRNHHNRTHPLIKFKTPVRNVSVTTMGEDKHGAPMATMGDKAAFVRPTAANTPSAVLTVADIKPIEAPIVASVPVPKATEKIQIKDLLAEPIEEKIKVEDLKPTPAPISSQELNAHYVRDTVKDGSIMGPSQKFVQVWTLKNPGPHAWPAGCFVHFVGGDRMFNIDDAHPSSEADLAEAQRSNVVGRAVEVGEEIAFRVLMKAPKQQGTAISYWRLKAADGVVFGHRLWCHIKVVAAPQPPAYTTSPVPIPISGSSVERAESASQSDNKEDFLMQLVRNHEEQLLQEQDKAVQAAKQHAESEAKMKVELEEKESRIQMLYDLQKQLKAFHVGAMEGHYKVAALSKQQKQVQARMISALKSRLDLEVSKRRQREELVAAELSATTPSVKVEPIPATVESEDGKTEGSAMIFPKLDKESPSASTHESVETAQEPATPETKNVVLMAVTSPSAKTETENDIFEDAESLDLLDSSDDDGFMTDEEYEILDASDEENNA